MPEWSFVTNHALVLATIARYPDNTAREVGNSVGITERATHKIIKDLELAGYITRVKTGRRNRYRIHPNVPLPEKIRSDAAARELLEMLGWNSRKKRDTK